MKIGQYLAKIWTSTVCHFFWDIRWIAHGATWWIRLILRQQLLQKALS